jgi:hypothetical protein
MKITAHYFTFFAYKLSTACNVVLDFQFPLLERMTSSSFSAFNYTSHIFFSIRVLLSVLYNIKHGKLEFQIYIYALTMTIVLSNLASRACHEKIRCYNIFSNAFACSILLKFRLRTVSNSGYPFKNISILVLLVQHLIC